MLATIGIFVFYLLMPAVVLRICHLSNVADKIGAVFICYLLGIIFGYFVINEDTLYIPNILSTIMIPLALPMLLFEVNIRSWSKMAGKAFMSMFLAIVGLVATVFVGFFIFRDRIQDASEVGGMLVGVYSGGTPNLAAIKTALNVPDHVYIAINTMDMFVSAIYLLFLLSLAKPLFGKWLPAYKGRTGYCEAEKEKEQQKLPLKQWLRKVKIKHVLAAFGVTLLCAGVGGGLGLLVKNESYQMAVIILSITTMAIIAANIKPVKKIQGSFDTGMYLILIFSIAVASMADFSNFSKEVLPLMGYLMIVVFGTLVIHLILCKLFKIDVDTMMVTSTALVCSPPFVPVICGAVRNREVMMSGITVGIIGYAVGNYFGIAIAYILQYL